jgi:hypothetical protein
MDGNYCTPSAEFRKSVKFPVNFTVVPDPFAIIASVSDESRRSLPVMTTFAIPF